MSDAVTTSDAVSTSEIDQYSYDVVVVGAGGSGLRAELEAWGALFDRTKDGKISQRIFGGHEYPRLAHVGDRTGLEMIRTLQQKIVALQQDDYVATGDYEDRLKVFQECTITELFIDGDRIAGAFGYTREKGEFLL